MTAKRSEQRKMEARERDKERKREKRDQMTFEQLEKLRLSEKERFQRRRQNMSKTEKEKLQEKDRNRKTYWFDKAKKRRNKCISREIKNIDKVLRVRKWRESFSEEKRMFLREKAKAEMMLRRKNGVLKEYKQKGKRTKRNKNNLTIWKDFFKTITLDLFITETPKLKHLHEKLNVLNSKVREMENQRRQEAYMYARIPTWKPERAFKEKCESVRNKIMKMRNHRQKIKEEIKDYEKLRRKALMCDTNDSSDSEYDESYNRSDSEHGDFDIYS